AVGGDDGVRTSQDGGRTWTETGLGVPGLLQVESLAFDPTDRRTLYAGTWRQAFRTRDGGGSWMRIAEGMVLDATVYAWDFSAGDTRDIWVSTCGWVYRTRDGGDRWTRFTTGFTNRRSHAVRPAPRRWPRPPPRGRHLRPDRGRTPPIRGWRPDVGTHHPRIPRRHRARGRSPHGTPLHRDRGRRCLHVGRRRAHAGVGIARIAREPRLRAHRRSLESRSRALLPGVRRRGERRLGSRGPRGPKSLSRPASGLGLAGGLPGRGRPHGLDRRERAGRARVARRRSPLACPAGGASRRADRALRRALREAGARDDWGRV